ncbi:uncharacterized protein LOC108603072 isoform X2 [Drosophila busckii]|uniref:uncharacterized protein LOC108603072 isoform X2 n=1 Tax=Drosophila busckii TaxID=30019 RepID=UPI00083F15D2|nr:uncharacterized protein LOC108603072 isoform X2 [Drosophila busckii]
MNNFITNLMRRSSSSMATSSAATAPSAVVEDVESNNEDALLTLAMNRCSVDTELDKLFVSATQDLNVLEKQHNDLIERVSEPTSPRETIQQLLGEINLNLDQVSANEMEHLQAMSLELSPLAVKSGPRHSLEQQKALAAALCANAIQPTTPPLPASMELFKPQSPMDQPNLKFTGLPEFDETQIPELAPLSADMEAQLKADECMPTLSSTVLKPTEQDYNSDSEIFVECLSLNSGKYSAEQSELEAYSSALNDVLDEQQANATTSTLEQTISDIVHNNSCEPMDVDEINETMEMLKVVLTPEDHQQLQQQFLDVANTEQMQQHKETESTDLQQLEHLIARDEQREQQLEREAEPVQDTLPELEQLEDQQKLPETETVEKPFEEFTESQERLEIKTKLSEQLSLATETTLDPLEEMKLESQAETPEEETPTKKPQTAIALDANICSSPPIPTHRVKTAEELEFLAQNEYPSTAEQQCSEQISTQLEQSGMPRAVSPVKSQAEPATVIKPSPPPVAVVMPTRVITPLKLDISETTTASACESAASSPSFPIKSPVEGSMHFPRSPHAPVDEDDMPYLEQAVIEPSIERMYSMGGVIAKAPLPLQLIVTHPSPEKLQEHEHQPLNATMSLENATGFNGTFTEAAASARRSTFGMPLDAVSEQEGRTYSVIKSTESPLEQQLNNTMPLSNNESPLNGTYGMPLSAASGEQRRTFTHSGLENQPEELLANNSATRRTFCLEETSVIAEPRRNFTQSELGSNHQHLQDDIAPTRRTFCMEETASPAMEATEENITAAEDEPMDIDISLRVEVQTAVASQPLSPPIPTHQRKQEPIAQAPLSPPIPTHQPERHISPPLPSQLKRPAIHGNVLEEQTLSAKEQLSASEEKEDVEHFGAISPISDVFKPPMYSSNSFNNLAKVKNIATAAAAATASEEQFFDAEFQDGSNNNNIILNSSDFDYLYTKGSNDAPVDRSSLLLKFDPLLGAPVPVNLSQHHQQQQELALLNILSNNNNLTRALSPTVEEHESSNQSFVIETSAKPATASGNAKELPYKPPVDRTKKHAKMSVDVIGNDCNNPFENSNLNTEDKTHKYNNMDELEKKIKNEVTRSEDIEKKLKEAEQREEALVKRITEKDKINSKLNGVVDAYEKAIAELVHDKEQLSQMHERQMQEVQADRDSNYNHLTSLETTFSDLHVKYEKSKEMTAHLKQVEDGLLEEKRKLMDKLRQQEQRYEQMKSHALQQMEIANKKLATITKEHADEVKKLKALLKKEEVSRISTAEQLQQKARENADLLKICEDLIYDKGQDF